MDWWRPRDRADLAAWRRDTMPECPDAAQFTIATDRACEVLSPSTRRLDQGARSGTCTLARASAMPAGPHGVLSGVIEAIDARCRTIQEALAK